MRKIYLFTLFLILQLLAASACFSEETAQSQYDLGNKYYFGVGVSMDYQKAIEWYQKAADQGYAQAQCSLGVMYANGEGVSKDYQKAAEWHQKAAEQGLAEAQFNLGLMYANGDGFLKDYQKAAEWYQKAAEQGDTRAQFNLGLMYAYGDGVSKDYKQAYTYLLLVKAGDLSRAETKEFTDFEKSLYNLLTPQQRGEAQDEATRMWNNSQAPQKQ